jgi:acetyl-CoA carboxylase biotin carboxyl carrier protein
MKTTRDSSGTTLKDKVNSLYELMKTEKLEELEVKDEDSYIYLKRKGKTQKHQTFASHAVVDAYAVERGQSQNPEEKVAAGDTVKSPITGIFYRAPSPASPPFAKEGDVVAAGKTLCIVEAMKVMNEVKAETGMKIIKILVENGKPITAEQDLFLVEKL